MFQKRFMLCTCAAVLAAAIACSKQNDSPVSPNSATGDIESPAAPDGSTLKASAPSAVSPVNNAQPDQLVLVATRSQGLFAQITPSYEFEIYNAGNQRVYASGIVTGVASGQNVSHTPTGAQLAFDAPHTWRVRGVLVRNGRTLIGPWSANAPFRSPAGGFIRGNELFDPLTNGPSIVMEHSNDVTWLPGVGARLNGKESVVQYRLQQPCVDCEMSALMTNIGNGGEEWKTKVLSMLQGDGINITDNPYRATVDKRTTWEGQNSRVRYTFCSQKFILSDHCDEPRMESNSWSRSEIYFWKLEWRAGTSRLRVWAGGKNGRQVADLHAEYDAPYAPNPHLVRLGSVGGRAGSDTNPGTIIWNIWVSPNPRPDLPGDR
jgi:hypothetical protein